MQPPWIFSTRSSAPTTSAPGLARLLLLLALGEHRHPHRLADAVREHDGAAHHLVGVLGIHPEAQRHVHRLVELGAGQLLEDAERLLDRVGLLAVVEGLGCLELLGRGCHLELPFLLRLLLSIGSADYRLLLQALQLRGPRNGPRTPPGRGHPFVASRLGPAADIRCARLLRFALLVFRLRRLRCPCCGRCPRRCAWRTRWSRCSGPPAWSGRSRAPGRASPCRSCPCAAPPRPWRSRPPA